MNLLNILKNRYYLTSKGIIASNIHECHCLILGDFIYSGKLDDLSCRELVSFSVVLQILQ